MTLKEIIIKKSKLLDAIPNKFLTSVEKSQKVLYNEMVVLLNKLELTSDGRLVLSQSNYNIAAKISEDLKTVLLESPYTEAVKDFSKEFDTLKTINDTYFNKAYPDYTAPDVGTIVINNAKRQTVTSLLSTSVDNSFIEPIKGVLDDAITSGASFLETLQNIRLTIEGGENSKGDEVDGKLLKYAKQIAHDNFAIADRSYTNAIADDLESEWFLYDGTEVADSRCFCMERKGNYYHYKEIQAWGRGEKVGECGKDWQGKNANTNEATIFILAGGYNCLDSIMPVSLAIVPIADVKRAMELGYFEPSEFERKELGL
jgi:hypothetical protein